jgi:hypothetical protein
MKKLVSQKKNQLDKKLIKKNALILMLETKRIFRRKAEVERETTQPVAVKRERKILNQKNNELINVRDTCTNKNLLSNQLLNLFVVP